MAAASDTQPEVFGMIAFAALSAAKRGGVPMAPITKGLSFDHGTVRRRLTVSWDEYCTVLERIDAYVGQQRFSELAANEYPGELKFLERMVQFFVDPIAFMIFVVEVLDAIAFASSLECTAMRLGPDSLRSTMRLRPRARDCEAFFRGTAEAFRGLPRHMGLPSADVVAQYDARQGTYDVAVAPSRTVFAQRGGMVAALQMALTELFPKEATADDPAIDLGSRWGLTTRQVDVLRLLVGGKSNKEIAQGLGVAENTVEFHVTQLFRRAHVTSRTELIAKYWTEV